MVSNQIKEIKMKNMWLLFAILSAVIFLGETFTRKTLVGSLLLLGGTLVMVL